MNCVVSICLYEKKKHAYQYLVRQRECIITVQYEKGRKTGLSQEGKSITKRLKLFKYTQNIQRSAIYYAIDREHYKKCRGQRRLTCATVLALRGGHMDSPRETFCSLFSQLK